MRSRVTHVAIAIDDRPPAIAPGEWQIGYHCTTAYLAAGTRRLEEMQADHTRAWDSFYEKHSSQGARLLPWEKECLGLILVAPGADVLLILSEADAIAGR